MDRSAPDSAAELAALKVDVIVTTGGTPSALAAKRATTTIPIVITGVGDAVGTGLVASLSRPAGNITGLTDSVPSPSSSIPIVPCSRPGDQGGARWKMRPNL